MTEEIESSKSDSKPSRWRKFLKRLGITLAIIVTLLVLIGAYENWSGAREWKKVSEELTEAGVDLDFRNLLPTAPPADQNFGALPILAAQTDFTVEGENNDIVLRNPELVEKFRSLKLPKLEGEAANALPHRQTQNSGNLRAIREVMAASEEYTIDENAASDADAILAALQKFESDFAEIYEASKLPHAFLEQNIGNNFLEHISMPLPQMENFMNFQKLMFVRATAAIESGDKEQAMRSLNVMHQMSRLTGSQPFLISNLVEMSCREQMLTVVWLGNRQHFWNDDDLRVIQKLLDGEDKDLLDRLATSMNLELCTIQIGSCDFLKTAGGHNEPLINFIQATGENEGTSNSVISNRILHFVPDGIWDHNKAIGARLVYETGIRPLRERDFHAPDISFKRKNPRNFLAHITVPALQSITRRAFAASCAINLAEVACALERFKKARSTYPSSLSELTPDFIEELPADLFSKTGEPFKYEFNRESNDSTFLLYSIGRNQEDDGGKIVMRGNSEKRVDLDKGDIVWKP